MITPPYLQPGDTIAIVCPSGFMPMERAKTCIDTLQQWGYKVRIGETLKNPSTNYFSGTDEERLQDLQQALDDPGIKAILCGRGGYGLSRIIDHIDFDTFEENPKWIIGFSDITLLHSHIYTNYKIATLHAPMAGAFNEGQVDTASIQSLKAALEGAETNIITPPHPDNRQGHTEGRLVGGNLSLLAHNIGTSSDIKTKGKILFLEDVGEYLYNLDRMLHQLKRSGHLAKLNGLLIGGFTELKDTQRPFGATVEEIIKGIVEEYDYPLSFDFPVSHGYHNLALKVGIKHELTVSDKQTILRES